MNANLLRADVIEPELLLHAYRSGFFPMAESREGEIHWYMPLRRGIIPLDGLRISRSLRRTLARQKYRFRIDTQFETVMRMCADRKETWISETIIRSYVELYRLNFAHSVETWHGEQLAGGLYGVALGGAFFGESMFSSMADASKAALVFLVRHLRERGFALLDTQYLTPHLESLGAVEISRGEYMAKLEQALRLTPVFQA